MPIPSFVRDETNKNTFANVRSSASRGTRRFTFIVSVCVGIFIAMLGSGALFIERNNYATARNAVENDLRQASLVVESAVNHLFLQVDGALASLPAIFAAASSGSDRLDAQRAT